MADLTTALIAQRLMNQRYRAAVETNTLPVQWQGLPATVSGLQTQMNDLYLRVNTIPHETVKIQKDVEAEANEWDTLISIGVFIVGLLIAAMTHSGSSVSRTATSEWKHYSPLMNDLFKDFETKGAKSLKRQSSRVVRAIRPK